jgi:hypothetical protein
LVAGGGAAAEPLDEAGFGKGPEGVLDSPPGQVGAVHDFSCLDPFFGPVLEGFQYSQGAFGKLDVVRVTPAVIVDIRVGFLHYFQKKPAKGWVIRFPGIRVVLSTGGPLESRVVKGSMPFNVPVDVQKGTDSLPTLVAGLQQRKDEQRPPEPPVAVLKRMDGKKPEHQLGGDQERPGMTANGLVVPFDQVGHRRFGDNAGRGRVQDDSLLAGVVIDVEDSVGRLFIATRVVTGLAVKPQQVMMKPPDGGFRQWIELFSLKIDGLEHLTAPDDLFDAALPVLCQLVQDVGLLVLESHRAAIPGKGRVDPVDFAVRQDGIFYSGGSADIADEGDKKMAKGSRRKANGR